MQTAKLLRNGREQAVQLPAAFRFRGEEVYIRRDAVTGDVILSERPQDWQSFIAAANALAGEDEIVRDQTPHERDPFADWQE